MFNIDPAKRGFENVLALINHANALDLTAVDVGLTDPRENLGEPEAVNTSITLTPLAAGRYDVNDGPLTFRYRRLSLDEAKLDQPIVKGDRDTTLSELHQLICAGYGFNPQDTLLSGDLPGLGTILPGETFELTLAPVDQGLMIYKPTPKSITITWDGVWLSELIKSTGLDGFESVTAVPISAYASDVIFTQDKTYLNTGSEKRANPFDLNVNNLVTGPNGAMVHSIVALRLEADPELLTGNQWTIDITGYWDPNQGNGDGVLFSRGRAAIQYTYGKWYVSLDGATYQIEHSYTAPAYGTRYRVALVYNTGLLSLYFNDGLIRSIDVSASGFTSFGPVERQFIFNAVEAGPTTSHGVGRIEHYRLSNEAIEPPLASSNPAGLISLLHFDEVSDTVVIEDRLSDVIWKPTNVPPNGIIVRDGVFKNSMRFNPITADKRSHYARDLPAAAVNAMNNEYTIDFWIKLGALEQVTIALGTNGGGAIHFNNGRLYVRSYASENLFAPFDVSALLFDSQWHHIRIACKVVSNRLFIDGVMRAKYSSSYRFFESSTVMYVGGSGSAGGGFTYNFDGWLDEIALFTKCLNNTDDSFAVPSKPW